MTQLSSKDVITRKTHLCFSCLREFPVGTKMNYNVGIYEGDFCAVYSCETCVDIMSLSDEQSFEEGFVSEQLVDDQTPEDVLKSMIHMDRISHIKIGETILIKIVNGAFRDQIYSGYVCHRDASHFVMAGRERNFMFSMGKWPELECHSNRIVLTEKRKKTFKY